MLYRGECGGCGAMASPAVLGWRPNWRRQVRGFLRLEIEKANFSPEEKLGPQLKKTATSSLAHFGGRLAAKAWPDRSPSPGRSVVAWTTAMPSPGAGGVGCRRLPEAVPVQMPEQERPDRHQQCGYCAGTHGTREATGRRDGLGRYCWASQILGFEVSVAPRFVKDFLLSAGRRGK